MIARTLAAVLRWHGMQRARPLSSRIALALLLTSTFFLLRIAATTDPLGAGRDLLFLGILLAALLFGLVPGLCAGGLARGLSIWWYVGPNGENLVPPWHTPGIALFLTLAIIAAALAGKTIELLTHPADEEDAPVRLGATGAPARPEP
jgi:hypothetical protein